MLLIHLSGDIGTKGANRPKFEKKALDNVKAAMAGCKVEKIARGYGRFYINVEESEQVRASLSKIAGVSWFAFAEEAADLEEAETIALRHLQSQPKTFRVEATRADKSFPSTSMEIAIELGGKLKDKTNIPVSLKNAEKTIYVEVAEGKRIFIYAERHEGLGGLPVGMSGKVIVLLSGGIDSPVAAQMMARRGCEVVYAHFHPLAEYYEKRVEKIRNLATQLEPYTQSTKIHFIPYAPFQIAAINSPSRYTLLLFRRFMLRIAEKIAEKEGASAIVTGEALGQVASQTLQNIAAVDCVAHMPIFRPLIGYDKQGIIDHAKKIGTYEISLQQYNDCCQSLMDRHPATSAPAKVLDELENKLDLDELIKKTLDETVVKQ